MTAGTRVTYRDVNLRNYVGVIVSTGRTPRGGDCLVRWSGRDYDVEECTFNLTEAREP